MNLDRNVLNALLALDVYARASGKIDLPSSFGGITVKTNSNTVFDENERAGTGFFAQEYNYQGETIIAYCGTDRISEDAQNYGMHIGEPYTPQGMLAVRFHDEISKNGDIECKLVGHSLGGALAGFVSSLRDIEAVIFDYANFKLASTNAYEEAKYYKEAILNGDEFSEYQKDLYDIIYSDYEFESPVGDNKCIGFSTSGEFLGNIRNDVENHTIIKTHSLDADGKKLHPDTGMFQLHSQALLTILLYVQDELSETCLSKCRAGLISALFNSDAEDRAKETSSYSLLDIDLATAIAYSLAGSSSPFGDSAMKSLLNDISKIVQVGGDNLYRNDEFVIRKAILLSVQYSGQLAFNCKPSNIINDQGIVTVHANNSLVSLDLTDKTWSNNDKGVPPTVITGSAELKRNLLTQVQSQSNLTENELDKLCNNLWGGSALSFLDILTYKTDSSISGALLERKNNFSNITGFSSRSGSVDITGSNGRDFLSGGVGDDIFHGGDREDLILGNAGHDQLYGDSGNDYLIGGVGDDSLDGGAGADTLSGGAGGDVLNGGSGEDFVSYFDSTAGVTVDMGGNIGSGGHASGDTYSNIENIEGSRFNDKLTGDSGNNLLRGGGGSDTLIGNEGNDTLEGGAGRDKYIATHGDIVSDSSGDGYVLLSNGTGRELRLGIAKRTKDDPENRYEDVFGRIFKLNGNTLVVTDGGTSITIEAPSSSSFTSGGWLGIKLKTEEDDEPNDTMDLVRSYSRSAATYMSPIVLDLDDDGIEEVSLKSSTTYFDMDGDGVRERTGWISGDDGFLVIDNNDGHIENVSELFGDYNYSNGYAKLQTYDSNDDGMIDNKDISYNRIKIWRDLNQNGISEYGEISSLADNNIESISTEADSSLSSTFKYIHGNTGKTQDLFFEIDEFDTVVDSEGIITPDIELFVQR